MSNENKFDVVIYGATGFTGKLVAEYMVGQYGHNKMLLGPWLEEVWKSFHGYARK